MQELDPFARLIWHEASVSKPGGLRKPGLR
jgi:hypothetical protein